MAIEVVEFQGHEDVFWAMTPKPEVESFENIFAALREEEKAEVAVGAVPANGQRSASRIEIVTTENLKAVLQLCIVGLAHNSRLAANRLAEAVGNERLSAQRQFEQGFVESYYKDGPLSVVAYTAANEDQPAEWLVEGFVGDTVTPDIHTLPMDTHGIPRVLGTDFDALNDVMNEWYPST